MSGGKNRTFFLTAYGLSYVIMTAETNFVEQVSKIHRKTPTTWGVDRCLRNHVPGDLLREHGLCFPSSVKYTIINDSDVKIRLKHNLE